MGIGGVRQQRIKSPTEALNSRQNQCNVAQCQFKTQPLAQKTHDGVARSRAKLSRSVADKTAEVKGHTRNNYTAQR